MLSTAVLYCRKYFFLGTTLGLSSVLVYVPFYLCQGACRQSEGKGRQRRCGTPVSPGSPIFKMAAYRALALSLTMPHPMDSPHVLKALQGATALTLETPAIE